jgi:hypothetical protein
VYFSPGDNETARYILSELGEQRTTVESETVRNSSGAFDTSEVSISVSLRVPSVLPRRRQELQWHASQDEVSNAFEVGDEDDDLS